jgi:antitoxin ParD1/3/4
MGVDSKVELSEFTFGMSKDMTPDFEKVIAHLLASGRCNNKSEMIRARLRLLEEYEAKTSAGSREDLSRIIRTALSDPRPLVPATALLQRRRWR